MQYTDGVLLQDGDMPPQRARNYFRCFCLRHNCEGALVSARTLGRHATADHHGQDMAVRPEQVESFNDSTLLKS